MSVAVLVGLLYSTERRQSMHVSFPYIGTGSFTAFSTRREELNTWCQRRGINYNGCWGQVTSGGSPQMFQSSFSFTLNSWFRKFVSKPHLNRKEAEEEVAEEVLEHQRLEEVFASMGHADRPPKKILQEWCGKKQLPRVPAFDTHNAPGQTFQSTVTLCVPGFQAVQGCLSKTKAGAENSASLLALSQLGELKS